MSMTIQKTIVAQPYYIPLSAHRLVSYTVNIDNDVVTANLQSYFNDEAMQQLNAQPLAQYSVVLKGKPTKDVLGWIGEQLVTNEAERVENEYAYQGAFQLADRFTFSGGTVVK